MGLIAERLARDADAPAPTNSRRRASSSSVQRRERFRMWGPIKAPGARIGYWGPFSKEASGGSTREGNVGASGVVPNGGFLALSPHVGAAFAHRLGVEIVFDLGLRNPARGTCIERFHSLNDDRSRNGERHKEAGS